MFTLFCSRRSPVLGQLTHDAIRDPHFILQLPLLSYVSGGSKTGGGNGYVRNVNLVCYALTKTHTSADGSVYLRHVTIPLMGPAGPMQAAGGPPPLSSCFAILLLCTIMFLNPLGFDFAP
jgi:hypothetical protein